MGATAFGVHDTLGNPLAVKVREQVDEVEVLEEKRAVLTHTLGLVWMGVGDAIAGAVEGVLGLCIAVVNVVPIKVTVLLAVCVGSHDGGNEDKL